MNKQRSWMMVGCAACLTAGAVTFDVGNVRQRYPWNGLVDIDYTVAYGAEETQLTLADAQLRMEVVDAAASPATTNVARSFVKQYGLDLAPGAHRAVWNATADGVTTVSSALKVSLSLVRYPQKYLVVDLSNGSRSYCHSVAFLDEPPAGGFNTDEYKTKKIAFRLVPAGTFLMGSPESEFGHASGDVERQRTVTLTQPFYISIFEFTRAQYTALTGKIPGDNRGFGATRPYTSCPLSTFRGTGATVTATSLLGILSRKTGMMFDLPSEAQWEWACRAGTTTPFNDGVSSATSTAFNQSAAAVARMKATASASGDRHPGWHTEVGSYAPNAWGLYDMHGNVREILRDRYMDVLPEGPVVDPAGGSSGTNFCCNASLIGVTDSAES